ncbi:hypothetical protein [Bradyrhizobium neotropicale]|uniref:hypothetical protein n=1 Tax=Bradyrhizobium neotropicale TaxID=1497615 RepID=UPI001AD7DFFA|nr:hypothetical protein [Bradyrhizobium neotropicale]MBO4225057.1 hypothetical protein [Bradyrhizobium neotropicale]
MKRRALVIALLLSAASTTLAIAQSDLKQPSSSDRYVPRLGDIMSAAQQQHQKLWLAATAQNWQLATYELGQLESSLAEAAMRYSGIPVSNVTTLKDPLQSVSDAIAAKDGRKFAKAYASLTEGCNSCHTSMGRSFIAIRVPTGPQPFGNQLFPPQRKP